MDGFKYVPLIACEHDWKQMMHADGVFTGENTLSRTLPFILLQLSMFFLTTRFLRFILRPLKQTHFICNMLAGIILGTSVLGLFKKYNNLKDRPKNTQFLNFASCYGLIYHIFLINVKIDSRRLLKIGKKVRTIGFVTPISGFIVVAILNVILHPLSFRVHSDQYKFAFQSACNSIVNIAPLLEERQLLTTELGQVSLSAALISDILAAMFWILSILNMSFTNGFVKAILPLAAVILFTLYVISPTMQWVVRRTPHGQPVKEIYVIGVLLYLGIISALFDAIAGIPLLGVMIFGLLVPNGPPLGSAVVEMGEMFIENFLLPFFYLSIGDMVNLHALKDLKHHLMFQMIIIIGYVTRSLAALLLAMIYNMSPRQSITLGLLMNAAGVNDNAFTWLSWMRQRSDSTFATLLVMSSMTKGILVAPLAAYFSKHRTRTEESIRGFELSIQAASNSKMRILACIDNEDEVPGIISLLEASNPTESNPIFAYVVHLTELIGEAMPMLTPHRKHRRICKHNGCVQILNGLKCYSDNSEGRIALQLLTMIAPFKTMHEGLCRLAQDKMIPLIIVPFLYKSPAHYRQRAVSSDLNRKIQAHAPCTVGILVDRPNPRHRNHHQNYFSYKIVVLFFGGEDDREVLSYATRMTGHPGVSILMLRIIVEANIKQVTSDEAGDQYLDESLVEEFRTKITDNACAVYREVHVEDWVKAIHVIRSVNAENEYDLVMVGRRHGETSLQEQHMCALNESPELGFIGEMLASFDSQDQREFSVLVMQHCIGVDREALSNLMLLEDDNDM